MDVNLYPPREGLTAQEPPKTPPGPPRTPQGPPQSAPRCLQNRILAFLSRLCCHLVGQVAAKTRTRRQDDVKIALRCQFEPNLAQLKPILGLTWPHLGPPDLPKTLIFLRFFFKVFAIPPICVLRRPREPQDGPDRCPRGLKRAPRAPQRAPRWPQEAPKRPQDGAKRRQDGPKRPQEAPRRPQDGPKTTPRRPQVASKSLPSRTQKTYCLKRAPKTRPRGPKRLQKAPKSSKEAPKRPPRASQEAPKRLPGRSLGRLRRNCVLRLQRAPPRGSPEAPTRPPTRSQ